MLNFICEDLKVRNITFGDYLNVDLDYKANPRLSRPKRSSVITQGQLAFMEGRRLTAENCRFVSRLNLCPIVGADYSEYRGCHFESTDDALNGNARYEDCDFDFYGSRPLYNTSGYGAAFIRCTFNIHHNGSQFFTKRPGKVKVVDSRLSGLTAYISDGRESIRHGYVVTRLAIPSTDEVCSLTETIRSLLQVRPAKPMRL